MLQLFEDSNGPGFFFISHDSHEAEKLILRHKEWYDGAIPSGNSIACYVLIKLGELTGNHLYLEKAAHLLDSGVEYFKNSPSHYSFMMLSLNYLLSKRTQTVIITQNLQQAQKAIESVRKNYDPYETLLVVDTPNKDIYSSLASYTKEMNLIKGKPAIYRCHNFSCEKPVEAV